MSREIRAVAAEMLSTAAEHDGAANASLEAWAERLLADVEAVDLVWMCPACGWGYVPPRGLRDKGDWCSKGHPIRRCEPVKVASLVPGPAGRASREERIEAARQALIDSHAGIAVALNATTAREVEDAWTHAATDVVDALDRLSPPGITVRFPDREELDALVDDLKVKAILRESWSPDQPEPLVRAVGRLMEAQDG